MKKIIVTFISFILVFSLFSCGSVPESQQTEIKLELEETKSQLKEMKSELEKTKLELEETKSKLVSQPQESQLIKVGDTVPCMCGETFEMYIYTTTYDNGGYSSFLTDDKARLEVSLVLEKENDVNQKNDYYNNRFFKYTYSLNISGTVDPKYAGQVISMFIHVTPTPTLAEVAEPKAIVSEDGTFNLLWTIYTSSTFVEWAPIQISIKGANIK